MNENLINRIKTSLNSEFYRMNDVWLRDCIEYFLSTHDEVADKEILQFVKTQWQLSDLREINNENGCLPKNLAQQYSTVLSGNYILQVEKMYDISTSKYKQFEQIKNISTANVEATETEKSQAWEPKKKRMLTLYLTDGIQNVSAIEYSPIASLNDLLLPGYKIMLIGPIRCRRGIILLEESRFKEIGGEVESLLIPNALENVLARALNRPENPDPYNDNVRRTDKKDEPLDRDNFFEDEFEINLDEVSNIERQSQKLDNELSHRNIFKKATHGIQENNSRKENTAMKTKGKQTEIDTRTILDIDDDILEPIGESETIASTSSVYKVHDNKTDRFNNNNSSTIIPYRAVPEEHDFNTIDDDDVIIIKNDVNAPNELESATCKRTLVKDKYISQDINSFPDDDFDFDDFEVVLEDTVSTVKPTNNEDLSVRQSSLSHKNNDSNKTESVNKSKELRSSCETLNAVTNNRSLATSRKPKENETSSSRETGNKRLASSLSPLSATSTKIQCMEQASRLKKKKSKTIVDYIGKAAPSPPLLTKICDFLCDVIEQTVDNVIFKTVRGQFITLGKLSKKNLCWRLEGTITDRTASMDVELASEVLEKLLGFSVEEFSQKKKLAKTNPEVDQELRIGCRNAEYRLKQLDALLELELKPDQKPKIVNITELTKQQKEIIDKRLKMSMI